MMLSPSRSGGISSRQSSSDLSDEDNKDEIHRDSILSFGITSERREELSSSQRASPSKRSASQLSTMSVGPRRAAQMGEQSRRKAQSESPSSDDSSSSSGEDDCDESFEATPKKKPKSSKSSASTKQNGKMMSKEASAPPYHFDKAEPLEDYSAAIQQSQEQNKARLEEMDRFLTANSQSGSSVSEVPLRVKDLEKCPFCYEEMPEHKSPLLRSLLQPWLDQYHLKRRIGATSTVEACQRHRDEARTIPEGRSKGWKIKFNEGHIKAQVKNEKNPFMKTMRRRIEDPSTSEFYNRIMADRKKYGRQAESTSAQMQNLNEMNAGYYGELGKELLHNTLVEVFIDYPEPGYDLRELSSVPDGILQHLSPHAFVERVLLPELILLLIIADQKPRHGDITMEDAKIIRDKSVDYGIAMFPSQTLGPATGGKNAFGDVGKSPNSSGSKKGSGSRASQGEMKSAKKHTHSPVIGSTRSPARKAIDRREVKTQAKTQTSLPPPSPSSGSQTSSRPRPRPAARKAVSEKAPAIITDLSRSYEDDNQSITSPEMNGRDLDSAIILSPNKHTIITGPISIPSSLESVTPQASQEQPGQNSFSVSQKFSSQQWRSSGQLSGHD